ncbi:MAG TPA: DNA polymerase III subunit chi [Acidobacteriota bacterium]|nr:DNA polymerase III subunit chi [Acidobacteriota bacterium]
MKTCRFHDIAAEHRDRFLFDLVEKAYDRRDRVVIFAGDIGRAEAIDRFLWIMKQEAFIPHGIIEKNETGDRSPVAIVTAEINPVGAGTLIADRHCGIDFACGFDTVHEFVDRSTPALHEESRRRFRAYRLRKINVEHVKAG